MFGFGLSFFAPHYFWVKEHPIISILVWLFQIRLQKPWDDGRAEIRFCGITFMVGWTSLKRIETMRNEAQERANSVGKMAEALHKVVTEATENTQKMEKTSENASENVENATKTDENEKKVGYLRAVRHEEGINTINVHSQSARELMLRDVDWTVSLFEGGVSLLVSDDDHVIHNDRSFTLPDYEHANTLEIGNVVVFGNKEKHLRAKVTGYQQAPDGARTYFYQVAK